MDRHIGRQTGGQMCRQGQACRQANRLMPIVSGWIIPMNFSVFVFFWICKLIRTIIIPDSTSPSPTTQDPTILNPMPCPGSSRTRKSQPLSPSPSFQSRVERATRSHCLWNEPPVCSAHLCQRYQSGFTLNLPAILESFKLYMPSANGFGDPHWGRTPRSFSRRAQSTTGARLPAKLLPDIFSLYLPHNALSLLTS